MGYGKNGWKISDTSEKKAVANQKNKGLGETAQ
jgi:hypothetical protein